MLQKHFTTYHHRPALYHYNRNNHHYCIRHCSNNHLIYPHILYKTIGSAMVVLFRVQMSQMCLLLQMNTLIVDKQQFLHFYPSYCHIQFSICHNDILLCDLLENYDRQQDKHHLQCNLHKTSIYFSVVI